MAFYSNEQFFYSSLIQKTSTHYKAFTGFGKTKKKWLQGINATFPRSDVMPFNSNKLFTQSQNVLYSCWDLIPSILVCLVFDPQDHQEQSFTQAKTPRTLCVCVFFSAKSPAVVSFRRTAKNRHCWFKSSSGKSATSVQLMKAVV